jgi:hypothetical protein
MTWLVGRGDPDCYVEEGEARAGESEFDTEIEALRHAINCEQDFIDALRRSRDSLRRRLRKLERGA